MILFRTLTLSQLFSDGLSFGLQDVVNQPSLAQQVLKLIFSVGRMGCAEFVFFCLVHLVTELVRAREPVTGNGDFVSF